MSSDSDDSEASRDLHETVNVRHRLTATRTPFITACCVELLFCVLMTSWMSDNDHYTVFFRMHSSKIGSKKIIVFVWAVFLVSAWVRFWCLCSTNHSSQVRKAGRWLTVVYMFFGTVNWLLYLTSYYVAHDAASQILRQHKVNLQLSEADHFFRRNTVSPEISKCLLDNDWNYEACGLHVESACTKPYDPKVEYAKGDCVSTVNMDGVPCCISETLQIQRPRLEVFGKEIPVSIVFMLIKWMSILLVGWVLRHGFFAAGVGTRDFSKMAYLDILDAVIFSENLNEDLIRGPAYGISSIGKPQTRNFWPYYSLYATFAIAFTTVLFSQMIYTLLAPRKDEDSEDEDVQVMVGSPKQVTNTEVPQTVRVATGHDDTWGISSLHLLTSGTRPGTIVKRDNPGMYRVRFLDDLEPQEMSVSIDQLVSPDMEHPLAQQDDELDGQKETCHGWLKTIELCKGSRSERFERKASVLDALRSLLCLNLPFLLWRLYLDAFFVDILQFAGRTMLIAKNAIWAALDLVKILACLNRDATCFGLKPLSVFSTAADSKFGNVWVGPSGMVATVAEFGGMMRTKELQKGKRRIQRYQEWLLAERKVSDPSDPGTVEAFDRKLKEVELQLAVADEKMEFTFP